MISDKLCGIINVSSRAIYGYDNKKIYKKFKESNKEYTDVIVGIKKNHKYLSDIYAVVEVTEFKKQILYCKIIKSIGSIYDCANEYEYIKSRYLKYQNNIIYKEISNVFDDNRLDLSNEYTISIDPEGCEDIDDALHVKMIDDKYEIGIHIADVSSFFDIDSEMDIEISKRCESIYFTNERFDMLPLDLMNICSLRQGMKKRVFSVITDCLGNVSLKKCVIVNKFKLTYENAEKRRTKDKMLNTLFNHVNATDMHDMIEKYMIFANTFVTNYLSNDGIFRNHTGIKNINKKYDKGDINELIVNKINNHNMKRAEYKIGRENTYHHGLNIQYYTHFTSPIRRYADILVHQQLNGLKISNLNEKVDLINKRTKEYDKICYDEKRWQLLKKISESEIMAIGIIVGFMENKVILYVEKYNCELLANMYSKKINKIVTTNEHGDKIIIEYDNNMYEYKLGTSLNITIFKSHKLKVKIGQKQ